MQNRGTTSKAIGIVLTFISLLFLLFIGVNIAFYTDDSSDSSVFAEDFDTQEVSASPTIAPQEDEVPTNGDSI